MGGHQQLYVWDLVVLYNAVAIADVCPAHGRSCAQPAQASPEAGAVAVGIQPPPLPLELPVPVPQQPLKPPQQQQQQQSGIFL
jgi:hypothetical protein